MKNKFKYFGFALIFLLIGAVGIVTIPPLIAWATQPSDVSEERISDAIGVLSGDSTILELMKELNVATKAVATANVNSASDCWFVQGGNAIRCEGATADAYETSLLFVDPTADRNFYFPNAAGAGVMLSTGNTLSVEEANGVWGANNKLCFEAATANDYELCLSPATDVGSDIDITAPEIDGDLNITGKVDFDAVIQSGTTAVAGSTLAYTFADAGGAIEVTCGGTSSGTTDTQIIRLKGGSTVVLAMTAAAADTGDWQSHMIVATTDGAAVEASGTITFATMPAGKADYQTTTLDTSAVTTWTVELDLNGTTDDFTVEHCIWKVLQ